MQVARAQGFTAHVYTDTRLGPRAPGRDQGRSRSPDNPRFVVTNLRQTPRFIYEKVYCARGDIHARETVEDGLRLDAVGNFISITVLRLSLRLSTGLLRPLDHHHFPANTGPCGQEALLGQPVCSGC